MVLIMALLGVDLEAAMSTQEPKISSPNQGTTSAASGWTEEELEDYVLKTKLEMSSMENTMGNSNYTGICRLQYCDSHSNCFALICLVPHSLTLQAAAVSGGRWRGGTSPSLGKRKVL